MGTLRQGNVVKAHTLLTFKAPELTLLYNQNPPLAKLKKPDRRSPRRSTKPHLFHSVPAENGHIHRVVSFFSPAFLEPLEAAGRERDTGPVMNGRGLCAMLAMLG